jgi:outer membrane lipoprotein-sorting protein
MNLYTRVGICLTFVLGLAVAPAWSQTPADGADAQAKTILKKADEARFPSEGFEVSVSIRTLESGKVSEARQYRVLSKGNENTIVMVTEPASDQGQIMLMKGRDLWLFLPSVSQPVRLSLAQRLTGEVANGDIARANFSGDYSPKLVGTERAGENSLYVLDLVAVDRGVTYQRVRYWVREGSFLPHKAEFYSASERLLKICTYENFSQLGGRVRPTRLVMSDALRKDQQSVLDYANLKMRDLPDKVFSKDYLKKLQ